MQYKDRRDSEEIQEILNRAKTANPLVPFAKVGGVTVNINEPNLHSYETIYTV